MLSFLLAQSIALSSSNVIAEPAGLVFKNGVQTQIGELNQGDLLQDRVTRETTIQENGTEYVDNCARDEVAIGITGVEFGGSDSVSTIDVSPYTRGRAEVRSWFQSAKTLPAEGLRVIIQNPSVNNVADQIPYTDRAYDQGGRSQDFIAALGTKHKLKFLALKTGENQMTYQIKRGNQVVESGEFVVTIGIAYQDVTNTQTIARSKENLPCRDKRHK
jgi:hypothetical protein